MTKYQAIQTDSNGVTRTLGAPTTADKARARVDKARRTLRPGSSATFAVREVQRPIR